jgi:cytochrome c-type biogenesis protein CcmH/NrfF
MSGEAAEMRNQVTQMVTDGMTEQQIIDHYKEIYGEKILTVPDGLTGEMAYTFPVVASLLGLVMLSLFIRHALRPRVASGQIAPRLVLDDSQKLILERIHAELGDGF